MKSRYIITAEEDVCEELEKRVKTNRYVIDTFQNTGNWYSNGETGPEWFTLTIEAKWNNKEEIEQLVKEELKEMGKSAHNFYWG
jgi:hypothetical protein